MTSQNTAVKPADKPANAPNKGTGKPNQASKADKPANAPNKGTGKPADALKASLTAVAEAQASKPTGKPANGNGKPASKPAEGKIKVEPQYETDSNGRKKSLLADYAKRHPLPQAEINLEPETLEEALEQLQVAYDLIVEGNDVLYAMDIIARLSGKPSVEQVLDAVRKVRHETDLIELTESQDHDIKAAREKRDQQVEGFKKTIEAHRTRATEAEKRANERIAKADSRTAKTDRADKASAKGKKAADKAESKAKAKGKASQPAGAPNKGTGKPAQASPPAKPANGPNKGTGKPMGTLPSERGVSKAELRREAANRNAGKPGK